MISITMLYYATWKSSARLKKNISEGQRQRYPQVKWRKIAGFRDIVAHNYFGVSDEIVWDIIENEIPALLAQVSAMPGAS